MLRCCLEFVHNWKWPDSFDLVVLKRISLLFESVDFIEGVFGNFLIIFDFKADIVDFFLQIFIILLEELDLRS